MFKGKKSVQEIKKWSAEFHKTVDKAVGNQHLHFTVEIWTNNTNLPFPAKEENLQVVTNVEFSFLDMIMSWSPEGGLQFFVFRKKGQKLDYVGIGSTHTPGTLRAIPSVVLNRLAKITSRKTSFNY